MTEEQKYEDRVVERINAGQLWRYEVECAARTVSGFAFPERQQDLERGLVLTLLTQPLMDQGLVQWREMRRISGEPADTPANRCLKLMYLHLGGIEPVWSELSLEALRKLHGALRRAFDEDEASPEGVEPPHGVRKYRDWRYQSDKLEGELVRRGDQFQPIPW